MAPLEVKLLKPNPAGCWHCVPAMMHGLLVLCGPRVFPAIGPVSVRTLSAEAAPVSANIAAVAPTASQLSRPCMGSLLCCLNTPFGDTRVGRLRKQPVNFGRVARYVATLSVERLHANTADPNLAKRNRRFEGAGQSKCGFLNDECYFLDDR